MRLLRSPLGAITSLFLLAVTLGCAFAVLRVDRTTRPPRQDQVPMDFGSVLMRVEEVSFTAADGVPLSGWLLPGPRDRPTVLLCHDNGSSKSALINLAIALRKQSFTVFLFDFRGHGASGGGRSTMGILEKRDVLGAVDYVMREAGRESSQLGIYGIGTGAHAAVLAAIDRPNVKVLVLDHLYPDAGYPLARAVFAEWEFATRHLRFLPGVIFAVLSGTSTGSERASDAVEALIGRDLLLLAPEGDAALRDEMLAMYERIPEQIDVDGNLVFTPTSRAERVYGELRTEYHDRVTEFFGSRLVATKVAFFDEGEDGAAPRAARRVPEEIPSF